MKFGALARLCAGVFLGLWAWGVERDPSTVHAMAEDAYQVEVEVQRTLWSIDRAAIGFIEDEATLLGEGLTHSQY